MAKIPIKPEEIFPEITQDYQRIYGAHLLSLILYGSGAGEDYVPGKSDLNFLITVTDPCIERLDLAVETVARWRKRNVAIPLFVTRSFLRGALDAYPIEFPNMKPHYIFMSGEDAHWANAATAAAVVAVFLGQTTCGSPFSGSTSYSYSRSRGWIM